MSVTEAYADIKILDSFDNEVYSDYGVQSKDGTIVFTYKIPRGTSGGNYQIKIESFNFATTFRKFRINTFVQPELFVTVDFDKNSYSPGDSVVAKVKVRKPDGESLPIGSSIAMNIQIPPSPRSKGFQIEQNLKTLNKQGEYILKFDIQKDVEMEVLTMSIKTYLGYT